MSVCGGNEQKDLEIPLLLRWRRVAASVPFESWVGNSAPSLLPAPSNPPTRSSATLLLTAGILSSTQLTSRDDLA